MSAVEAKESLLRVRGGAPKRAPTVRVLAAYSGHTDCNLASVGFAAGVDFDRLHVGTKYEAPFGQSPFAFSRGTNFERIVRSDDYAATLDLLRAQMRFPRDARTINLRNRHAKNRDGMRLRAVDTQLLIERILKCDRTAPNLIDGAVLETKICGVTAHFEADALAARIAEAIHAGEVKSFPVVDGRADPDKLGSALDQVSVYILLTRRLVDALGGNPDIVSPIAIIITPRNVALTPTLSTKDVTKRIARIERFWASVPDAEAIADSIPEGINFGLVADRRVEASRRIDRFHDLADRLGTFYKSTCLSTCGNALACRDRARRCGLPSLSGPSAGRLLPGVPSLMRAAELTHGVAPSGREAPAAEHLARAGRLYDAAQIGAVPSVKKAASA
jgi:hypothetical protein